LLKTWEDFITEANKRRKLFFAFIPAINRRKTDQGGTVVFRFPPERGPGGEVMTVATVMAELKKKGTAQSRKIYGRHGMDPDRVLGVSSADMKVIAKSIKGDQALAMSLYKTGIMEAMYVAGMVASGAKMSAEELQEWAEGSAGLQMISEYTVPWVTVENALGPKLAVRWMGSKTEQVAAAGWCSYAGILTTKADSELDLKEIDKLLGLVAKGIGKAKNRERYCMNRFLICAGSYVRPMVERATAVAREIGEVKVEMGETDCKVPLALTAIEKASGSAKKKTIRC
jgi:3-methyladenine DNA glycosylase AlkD